MKKLRFQIRTWNRAQKLEKCITRIAEEIIKAGAEKDCIIFVIDNHSTDSTPLLLQKLKKQYPFLITYRADRWHKMREQILIPQEILKEVDSEFMWTMGDDDIILKDTFPIVWNFLNSEKAKDFILIHAGSAFYKNHSMKIYEGTIFEFANSRGFNQFLGWAGSLIHNVQLQKAKLNEMENKFKIFQEKYLPIYQKTAFPHVLRYLHLFPDEPALLIDYPIAAPMKIPSIEEFIKRWEKENVGWGYFLFVKALKKMYDDGILTTKLKPGFFKYIDHYLWDRFLNEMILSRIGKYTLNPRPDEGWEIIKYMAELIDDVFYTRLIFLLTNFAKSLCDRYLNLKEILNNFPATKEENFKKVKEKLEQEIKISEEILEKFARIFGTPYLGS